VKIAAEPAGTDRRGLLRAALVSVRPAEWMKNVFVLAPLVFASKLDEIGAVARAGAAFVAFCAVAGAGYVVNDLRDRDLDREHPTKQNRPIAKGELPPGAAIGLALILALGGLAVAAAASPETLLILVLYAVLTTTYSAGLKHVVIIDVMAIATGFVLRVEAGVHAIDAPETVWLLMCTGMLAMLLGFTKRRQEAVSELHDGLRTRPVLEHYSLPFLDQMVAIAAGGTILTYALSTVNSENIEERMLATAVPVVYAVLRYLYLIYHRRDHRSTADLIASDPGMIGAGVAWIVLAAALLYL
jgi:4-hydroxybenzoate polyprenyltransferase